MENITAASPTSNVTLLNGTSHNTTEEFYDDFEDDATSHLNYFTLVVYSLAFLLGTTGNGLVIWITIFKMKKTVNVIWFLNLSIADFTFTLFLPLSIVYLANDLNWVFGTFMCKLNSTIAFINLFASVFLLTVISIDRCVSVIFPVWSQNHRTPRLALFVVTAVWILAIILSLPFFVFRDVLEYDDGTHVCYNNYALGDSNPDIGKSRHKGTIVYRFIFGFIIPFTIIVMCYSVIVFRIRRNHMTTSTKPFTVIIAVIVSFFICWVPYHIFSFLELHVLSQYDDYLSHVLRVGIPLSSSLAFMNSCVNPFLYVFIGRDFKEKFSQSMHSIFERAFNEDSVNRELKSKTKSTCDSQLV
ncbi:chemerin-like receptor 1 [Dendropsophus ebraccatus]|uniref:chemerin-like receptor 1 n=1 Tax=Dendropsophus ebraccatus TaxID=150705 RepID=UPI00383185AD